METPLLASPGNRTCVACQGADGVRFRYAYTDRLEMYCLDACRGLRQASPVAVNFTYYTVGATGGLVANKASWTFAQCAAYDECPEGQRFDVKAGACRALVSGTTCAMAVAAPGASVCVPSCVGIFAQGQECSFTCTSG